MRGMRFVLRSIDLDAFLFKHMQNLFKETKPPSVIGMKENGSKICHSFSKLQVI